MQENRYIVQQPHVQTRQPQPVIYTQEPKAMSCLEIAGHVQECPICSKFYNNDKTVYIIVIIIHLL